MKTAPSKQSNLMTETWHFIEHNSEQGMARQELSGDSSICGDAAHGFSKSEMEETDRGPGRITEWSSDTAVKSSGDFHDLGAKHSSSDAKI